MRGSSVSDGPVSRNHSSVLEEEASVADAGPGSTAPPSPFAAAAALAAPGLLEITFEAFKEILSTASLRDEDVAPIAFIANAPQIAERTQRIQGARDDRLGHAEPFGKATHGMRAGGEVDEQHQRHLAIGEIGLAGANISDEGAHPAAKGLVCHGNCSINPGSTLR